MIAAPKEQPQTIDAKARVHRATAFACEPENASRAMFPILRIGGQMCGFNL